MTESWLRRISSRAPQHRPTSPSTGAQHGNLSTRKFLRSRFRFAGKQIDESKNYSKTIAVSPDPLPAFGSVHSAPLSNVCFSVLSIIERYHSRRWRSLLRLPRDYGENVILTKLTWEIRHDSDEIARTGLTNCLSRKETANLNSSFLIGILRG